MSICGYSLFSFSAARALLRASSDGIMHDMDFFYEIMERFGTISV